MGRPNRLSQQSRCVTDLRELPQAAPGLRALPNDARHERLGRKPPSGRLRAVYRDAAGDRHRELFDRRQVKAFLATAAATLARGQWVDRAAGRSCSASGRRSGSSRVTRRATAPAYATTLRAHLVPAFGRLQLKNVGDVADRQRPLERPAADER